LIPGHSAQPFAWKAMPSLFRFLVVLIVLAAIGGAAMYYLANYIEPNSREMSVRVPADKLTP
jgi:hypothetical protein